MRFICCLKYFLSFYSVKVDNLLFRVHYSMPSIIIIFLILTTRDVWICKAFAVLCSIVVAA